MRTAVHFIMSMRFFPIPCPVLVLVAWLSCCLQPAQAQSVILDFGSLPSAQGWTYVGSHPEDSVFTLGTNMLKQNSMGINFEPAFYAIPVVDVSRSFTLYFTGRVIRDENTSQANAESFGVEVDYITRSFTMGLSTTQVIIYDGNSHVNLPLDTSVFHDFLFTGNPVTNQWTLSIDGTPLANGMAQPSNYSNNLSFGDLTLDPNAQGEWTRLEFSQVAVPEPGTIFLTSASAIGFGIYLWRRKRQLARLAME